MAILRIQAARQLDERLARMSGSTSRDVRDWGKQVAEMFGPEAARESFEARKALAEMKGTGGKRRPKGGI
jgi:hypothetical protein